MEEHFIILGRSAAAFIIYLLITRILGKQTLSNMTFHDFVAAIILGAISANLAFNGKIQVTHFLISIGVFTGVSYLLSKLAVKSRKIRKVISGAPTVLIENGKILEGNMKKNKYTLDALNEMLREKVIYDINEVEYVILESNGRISVMRKKEYKTVTLKDLNMIVPGEQRFPVELIMDGQAINENMSHAGVSMEKLVDDVKKRGRSLEEVFYAVRSTDGAIYYDFHSDRIMRPIDKE
ncbi:hypothetical protein DNH61_14675 [Paenibacillus sambharensis]|uniref:DUF421 domain-containing protein n=1 Tax=Paenibacillus sambharensis TaxID=1803190 RepID=A0A2W1LJS7_9BACL|nr:hypothetical protein DNH61_14675 [Paenibacillus sambharensis]